MSASREKKLRQDQTASGYVDPKAEKELEKKKAEKRSNVLYSVIAVLFVLVVAASFLWRSNVISRNATALTIDGETYNAAEVNFYYQNVYRGFLQSNSYFISYLGLDTNASLKSQTVNATAASMMGVEEGSSWHDYIMDNTVKQMTMIQRGLKQAQEEGYQFPASVQEQYEDSLNSLKTSAESTGMSVKAYLQRNLGAIMTEKVYNQQVLRMLQYQAYAQSYSDSLTYTDAELEAAYQADPKAYDKAAWEYVVVSGAADSTTDADGNTLEPVSIPRLPYFRLQHGTAAVICDPKVGDIGLAIFAQQDCSRLNGGNSPVAPGTFRCFDMSDGFYIGGFWGQKPTTFVRIEDSGDITITGPQTVTVNTTTATVNASGSTTVDSPTVTITGDTTIQKTLTVVGKITGTGGMAVSGGGGATVTGNVAVTGGDVSADGIGLKSHVHDCPQGGTTSTGHG